MPRVRESTDSQVPSRRCSRIDTRLLSRKQRTASCPDHELRGSRRRWSHEGFAQSSATARALSTRCASQRSVNEAVRTRGSRRQRRSTRRRRRGGGHATTACSQRVCSPEKPLTCRSAWVAAVAQSAVCGGTAATADAEHDQGGHIPRAAGVRSCQGMSHHRMDQRAMSK